jgi:hypothetical protein
MLWVGVTVHVFQAGLMHVLMGVLGPVLVGVGVLVRDMLVLMRGVRMRVSHIGVLVFVRVRGVMGVRLGHGQLLVRNMLWLAVIHGFGDTDDSATTFSPVPSR